MLHDSGCHPWDVKKCKAKLRAPWKQAHQELWNEPPLDIAVQLPHYPFLASLIQTRSRGWPERDLGVMGELCHVGAHFEALDESVLTAPSVLSCIFFTILTLPSERCAHRSGGKSRDIKKCRAKLRALWKSAHQELRNEPPHDIAVRLPQNPFLASLWIA